MIFTFFIIKIFYQYFLLVVNLNQSCLWVVTFLNRYLTNLRYQVITSYRSNQGEF